MGGKSDEWTSEATCLSLEKTRRLRGLAGLIPLSKMSLVSIGRSRGKAKRVDRQEGGGGEPYNCGSISHFVQDHGKPFLEKKQVHRDLHLEVGGSSLCRK